VTRRKYIYASFFLVLSLVSFVIQTETAVYIQHTLKWKKAYCMLWLTHGSWSLLWPAQLLILRIQKRKLSWPAFWRRHKYLVRTTAQMVQHQELHLTTSSTHQSPIPYMIRTTVFVATALTIAGASWYVAVDLTTPSDLTAIYNCSAFFAYVFSIMLLHDKLRLDKAVAVTIAIAGVLVVAYGDTKSPKHSSPHGGSSGGGPKDDKDNAEGGTRTLGNLIIGVGSVLYGLYEVLYKKWACPPEGTSPGRGMIFANTFGSLIGLFTLTVLWIPLPILHFTGLEPFELPHGKAAGLLFVSTISNAVFSGSFLVLMSLTSPVLSSVAALLTIFLVAITDSLLHPEESLSAAAIGGGSMIIVAFAMLSWATYREMDQERKKREADEGAISDDDDD
jgi:drug/metabolite transporter (DMT)-like permease